MSRTRRGRNLTPAVFRSGQPARKPRWQRAACRDCGRPVIVAEEDQGGGRLKGAVIEGSAALYGILVRTIDGVLVRDPAFALPGIRYAWHHCPVRNG